jgi:hypothetical protein
MVQRSPSPFLDVGFDKSFETSQYSDSMFAVALTGGAEFVQDGGFSFTRGFFITQRGNFFIFFS